MYENFPYTNMQNLNLDWFLNEFKKLLADFKALNLHFDTTLDEWNAMKKYINDYFTNLDVQLEIDNKIDSLVANGTYADLTEPATIAAVNAWMKANITNPTSPVIDKSLTIEGAAADAKTVGDNFKTSNNNINIMLDKASITIPSYSLTSGYLDYYGNIKHGASDVYYTSPIKLHPGDRLVAITSSYAGSVSIFGNYNSGNYGESFAVSTSNNITKYEYVANTDIDIVVTISNSMTYYIYIDNGANSDTSIFNTINDYTIIPRVYKNIMLLGHNTFRQGYWTYYGTFSDVVGSCCIVSLEANTPYVFYTGGFSGYAAIVELDSNAFIDGNVLATFHEEKAQLISFKTSTKTNIGICFNSEVLQANEIFIAENTAGFLTNNIINLAKNTFVSKEDKTFFNKYYVNRPDGNSEYDYNNLINCFKDVSKITEYKEIYIYSGHYNLFELLGGNTFFNNVDTSLEWSQVQPVLSNVRIVGIGDVILDLDLPSSYPFEKYWLFSALNLRGDFTIENLTINANNCRYCIHDESNADFPGTKHVYNNIKCNKRGNGSTTVGCGYSDNSFISINNCIFTNSEDNSAYSAHVSLGTHFNINNSIFTNSTGNKNIRISQEKNADVEIQICDSFVKELNLRPEYDYWSSENKKINMSNITCINTKPNISLIGDYPYTAHKYDAIYYDTSTNTSEILLHKTL